MLLSRCYHPAFTDSFTEFCAGYSSTGVRCNASSRYIFWYIYEPPWNLYPQLSEPLLTMCFPMRLKSRAFLKQSIPWDVKNSIYLPADRFLLKKPLLTIPPKQLDIWPKCQHCSVEHFTFNCIIQAHSGHLPCMLSKSTFIHAGHSRSGYQHNYLPLAFSLLTPLQNSSKYNICFLEKKDMVQMKRVVWWSLTTPPLMGLGNTRIKFKTFSRELS